MKGEQFEAAFLALNPKAVVPVLVHNGHVIPESTVICEYLEEAFPKSPRLYPDDPLLRAQVRTWTKAVDEELHPACSALTYVLSHRHTILRNGVGSFSDFLEAAGHEGLSARKQKWEWIQKGLEAPGAEERIRLYDAYLHKLEQALGDREWLVGNDFSMADVALAPYLNRLAMLQCRGLWEDGRLPRVERWFGRIVARESFEPAFVQWMPEELAEDMRRNGAESWPAVKAMITG